LFAVCRPDWQLIRQRARATPKSLREVQEACLAYIDCLSTFTTSDKEADAFARLHTTLEEGRITEPTEEDPRTLEEIRPLIEVTEEQKEELKSLAQQRMPGWEKRIEAMLLLKEEIEDAEKNGRPVMEGCSDNQSKIPCSWWEPAKHNPDLLIGMYRHGWGMWDSIILDENLSFRESIKQHFPAEFAAVTNNQTTVVENVDGQETHKQLPTGGIKFQNLISWPQSRSMTSLLMHLVKLAEKHRKGLDKVPETSNTNSTTNTTTTSTTTSSTTTVTTIDDVDGIVIPVFPDDASSKTVSESNKKEKKREKGT